MEARKKVPLILSIFCQKWVCDLNPDNKTLEEFARIKNHFSAMIES